MRDGILITSDVRFYSSCDYQKLITSRAAVTEALNKSLKMCWIFWDAASWNHLNYRRVRSRSFSSSCIVLSATSQLVIKFPSRNFPKAENSLCSVSREMILIILTVIFPMIKREEDYKVLHFLRDLMGVAQSFSIFRSISFAQW